MDAFVGMTHLPLSVVRPLRPGMSWGAGSSSRRGVVRRLLRLFIALPSMHGCLLRHGWEIDVSGVCVGVIEHTLAGIQSIAGIASVSATLLAFVVRSNSSTRLCRNHVLLHRLHPSSKLMCHYNLSLSSRLSYFALSFANALCVLRVSWQGRRLLLVNFRLCRLGLYFPSFRLALQMERKSTSMEGSLLVLDPALWCRLTLGVK